MELDKLGLSKLRGWLQKASKDQKLTRIALILGMAGIALIWLSTLSPGREPGSSAAPEGTELTEAQYRRELEEDLARIVRAVTGDQNPQVMITLEDSGAGVYAQDRRESSGEGSAEGESSYVVLKDSSGSEHGLSLRQSQPRVLGVVIVSRGAGDPAFREKLVNTARAVLGVSAGRICVVEGR